MDISVCQWIDSLPYVVFQSPLQILPELKFGTVTFQLTVILKHTCTSLLGVHENCVNQITRASVVQNNGQKLCNNNSGFSVSLFWGQNAVSWKKCF